MLEALQTLRLLEALKVIASPAGRARHEEDRRFRPQRQVPIARELLVDDEAVAVQRPASTSIQHATGKDRSAPHEIRREVGQCRAGRQQARAGDQARYAEELDGDE